MTEVVATQETAVISGVGVLLELLTSYLIRITCGAENALFKDSLPLFFGLGVITGKFSTLQCALRL